MPRKLTYKYVKQYFEERGCELLEEYKNADSLMEYRCECGEKSKISFSKFRNGRRCKKCGYNKLANKFRYSYKYVFNYFKEQKCELLENTYINSHIKMKYRCVCKNKSIITFDKFKQGKRCYQCGIKKNSGKNHGNYNHSLTEEERNKGRRYAEYEEWRKKVYKKYNYTCQKCKQIGKNLNAHHVRGYADNKKLRIVVSNGIVLCKTCHYQFHSKYGKRNTNRKQLNNFIKA